LKKTACFLVKDLGLFFFNWCRLNPVFKKPVRTCEDPQKLSLASLKIRAFAWSEFAKSAFLICLAVAIVAESLTGYFNFSLDNFPSRCRDWQQKLNFSLRALSLRRCWQRVFDELLFAVENI